MLWKSTPTPLGLLSGHSACATELLAAAAGPRSLGEGHWHFLGTQQQTHFNASAALLKRELDKQDKEGCISSKGSCGVGDGPREGWQSAQLSDQALAVGGIWTLV